jgi:hypothetical protein
MSPSSLPTWARITQGFHVNAKTIPVETTPGIGGKIKNSRGGKFKYDIFDTL